MMLRKLLRSLEKITKRQSGLHSLQYSRGKIVISGNEPMRTRFIGVKDLATIRLSLPAQFMSPIPNLEYRSTHSAPRMTVDTGTTWIGPTTLQGVLVISISDLVALATPRTPSAGC